MNLHDTTPLTPLRRCVGGRADAILGAGSFTSRSPLFGCNLDQYDQLVEEKLALSPALATSSRSGARVVAPLAGEILADAGAVAS